MPNGGFRMVASALKTYGYEPDPHVVEAFTKYRKTHNDGVFDAYTADVRRCRSSHILTGLPDAYGRGRIIGDYRRVALYGVARLIEHKQQEKNDLDPLPSSDEIIRDREELSEQVRALKELQKMAAAYGFDISRPAANAREAVQWMYFGYLAGVKEQNGAAMSLGRTTTFLDAYFARDLADGTLTESEVQEIIDDFVIKLRIVRFLRTPEYDELFAGDPTWVTESIAGMGDDGRPLVTKTSFRILQTLYNLGPAPEPNLTIWYSPKLPDGFRRFSAKVAIDTSSIQFESDEIMRRTWGDDGAIACCVSPMVVGKQMQFFGARANLAKCLLYAINGGRDEVSGEQIGPAVEPVKGEYLSFDEVLARFDRMMDWLAGVYVNAMNVIHYMHDKYAYERVEMALHDYAPLRTMAFGIAGMSVVADSLSAIKYAKVKVVRDQTGLVTDYQTEGEFPLFGNNDNRVDQLAVWLVSTFMNKLRKHPTYRNAMHTQSVLTITSNVVYGKATGNTPDGRRQGEPFAPGANPMHGRDSHGIHAAAASVAKIPYRDAADGISLTASLVPTGLGRIDADRITNLTAILDAFFGSTGYHMNVNVLNRDTLMDAMEHPEKYPSLTIRVSGYAVNFVRLTRAQQMDVITRTFHGGTGLPPPAVP
jgi:formate C-acetyltransferase